MGPNEQQPASSVLTREECFEFLGRASVGRIGTSMDALPVILPVHFALRQESVLFRTIPGTKLDAATLGAVIAFQVDEWEPLNSAYWSVLLQGKAREVGPDVEGSLVTSRAIGPWGRASRLVEVHATNIAGRRFEIAVEGPPADLPNPPAR